MTSILRKYARKAKNEWNSYSDIQVMVREATSNDPWGPSSSIMSKIARESDIPDNYSMMFSTLWNRLVDYQHVKHVMKSLILVEYLLKHSHDRFIADVRLRMDVIRRLKHYKFFVDGVDTAREVRHRAEAVLALLEDKEKLINERKIAKETEGKIRGFSHQYSGFYGNDGVDLEKDPFSNGQDSPLRIEYQREEQPMRSLKEKEETKSDEEDEVEVREVKKEKKVKKHKKKNVSKKKSQQPSEDLEDSVRTESTQQSAPAPKYVPSKHDFFESSAEEEEVHEQVNQVKKNSAVVPDDDTDDFLREVGNSKPIYMETDLVTGGNGYNYSAAAQLGWLSSVAAPAVESGEAALFDIAPLNKQANATTAPITQKPQPSLFDMDFTVSTQPSSQTPETIDPWKVATEISVLDNLNVTGDERKIKQNIESRRQREKTAPKLNQIVQESRKQQSDINPFDALVQAPTEVHPSNLAHPHQMALVPAGQFYDPNFNQALVPMNPYAPYGYGMPTQPMYPYQESYAYPRY